MPHASFISYIFYKIYKYLKLEYVTFASIAISVSNIKMQVTCGVIFIRGLRFCTAPLRKNVISTSILFAALFWPNGNANVL